MHLALIALCGSFMHAQAYHAPGCLIALCGTFSEGINDLALMCPMRDFSEGINDLALMCPIRDFSKGINHLAHIAREGTLAKV